jgi:hypothetical protein
MITVWLLYSIATTLALALAAHGSDRALRLAGRPARGVWLAALAGSFAIGIVALLAPSTPSVSTVASGRSAEGWAGGPEGYYAPAGDFAPGEPAGYAAGEVVARALGTGPGAASRIPKAVHIVPDTGSRAGGLPSWLTSPLVLPSHPALRTVNIVLGVVWVASSLVMLVGIARSLLRLSRARRGWEPRTVGDDSVLVAADFGPAAVGVLRTEVVLPRWALGLDPVARDLIVMHEREHARARDPLLLFGATVAVAISPLNAPLWWILHRLRLAVEMDCDARVLRARPGRREYGSLLLDVSERTATHREPTLAAALAEPVWMLERRLGAIADRAPRHRMIRATLAAIGAIVTAAAACYAPRPGRPSATASTPTISSADSVMLRADPGALRSARTDTGIGVFVPDHILDSAAVMADRLLGRTHFILDSANVLRSFHPRTVDSIWVAARQPGWHGAEDRVVDWIPENSHETDRRPRRMPGSCGPFPAIAGGWAPFASSAGSIVNGGSRFTGDYAGRRAMERLMARLQNAARAEFPTTFKRTDDSVSVIAFLFDVDDRVIRSAACTRGPVREGEYVSGSPWVSALIPEVRGDGLLEKGAVGLLSDSTEFAPGNRIRTIAVWGVIGNR